MIIFHFQAFVSDYRACLRLRALHPLRTPVFITAAVQKLNLKSPEPGWDNSGAAGEGMTPTVLVSFPWGGVFPTPKTSVWGVQIPTRVSKEQDLAGEGAEGQILTRCPPAPLENQTRAPSASSWWPGVGPEAQAPSEPGCWLPTVLTGP